MRDAKRDRKDRVTNWLSVYLDMDAALQDGDIEAARRRLHLAIQDASVGQIKERSYREIVHAQPSLAGKDRRLLGQGR
jgi:hypothetical protein